QMAVYETIKDGFLDQHLPNVVDIYRRQCGYMLDALQQHFPATASWTRPAGGMFIWVTLPAHIDAHALLAQAIEQHVAFVPWAAFFAYSSTVHYMMSISYVNVTKARIREGVAILTRLNAQHEANDTSIPAGNTVEFATHAARPAGLSPAVYALPCC